MYGDFQPLKASLAIRKVPHCPRKLPNEQCKKEKDLAFSEGVRTRASKEKENQK